MDRVRDCRSHCRFCRRLALSSLRSISCRAIIVVGDGSGAESVSVDVDGCFACSSSSGSLLTHASASLPGSTASEGPSSDSFEGSDDGRLVWLACLL